MDEEATLTVRIDENEKPKEDKEPPKVKPKDEPPAQMVRLCFLGPNFINLERRR